MPLTGNQALRLRINDRFRYDAEVRAGDGLTTTFKLGQGAPFSTMSAASAYVSAAVGWSATGATFDTALGTVAFSAAISANTGFRVDYQWAVFSDDELAQFTADGGGSVMGGALYATRALMFDSLRRARWASPDGSQFDDTKAQDQLMQMYSAIWYEIREGPDGGIESWSQQQQNFYADYAG